MLTFALLQDVQNYIKANLVKKPAPTMPVQSEAQDLSLGASSSMPAGALSSFQMLMEFDEDISMDEPEPAPPTVLPAVKEEAVVPPLANEKIAKVKKETTHGLFRKRQAKITVEEDSVAYELPPELLTKIMEKDESFSDFIIRRIDASGMTDVECYTKARITRQLFNKVKNVKGYKPGKNTAVALGFALGLDRKDFDEMLRKAGFSLSKSSEFDLIVEYCIDHGIYNVDDINELMYSFDQPILGSS